MSITNGSRRILRAGRVAQLLKHSNVLKFCRKQSIKKEQKHRKVAIKMRTRRADFFTFRTFDKVSN